MTKIAVNELVSFSNNLNNNLFYFQRENENWAIRLI